MEHDDDQEGMLTGKNPKRSRPRRSGIAVPAVVTVAKMLLSDDEGEQQEGQQHGRQQS